MFALRVTDELELALLERRHAEIVFAEIDRNRDHLAKWLPWVEGTKDARNVRSFIEAELTRFTRNNGFSTGIFYRGEYAGNISIHDIDWNNKRTSIGYWLGEANQGKGIMTSACRTLTDYAFRTLGLNRVEIRARPDNIRSRAIPERLGFTQEGVVRQVEYSGGLYHDHVVYGMLASEWDG